MAERYLHPKVVELVNTIGRRSQTYTEDRIRREGRRFYKDSKKARLNQLLKEEILQRDSNICVDTRRKLTNLASAEASRKKKQYIQEKSFQALRRKSISEISLVRAICTLVSANERQRKENIRISALLAKCIPVENCSGIQSEIDISSHMQLPVDTLNRFSMRPAEVFSSHEVDGSVVLSEARNCSGVLCEDGAGELEIGPALDQKSQTTRVVVPEAVDEFSSVSSDKYLDMD